jgi:DNA-binding transcriptional regulator YdaS (Cro superfamily)
MDKKTEALERAVCIARGQSELKRRLTNLGKRVSQQSISLWRKAGELPAGWAIWVARAVEFEVTPHELDPVGYPNPWDGLPLERGRQLMTERLAA